jgi:uncharacterized protein YqhQ
MSNQETSAKQFSYGGQAVIEGVMMRGAHKAAVAARAPNGDIHLKEITLNATLYRGRIAKTPFLRGLVGLWDALGLGTRALLWSADVAMIEGAYYRVDYNGQVGWMQYAPERMTLQGALDSLPTFEKDPKETAITGPHLPLTIADGKTVKVLKHPNMDAKKLGQVSGQTLNATGFMAAGQHEDIFSGAGATLMIAVSLAFGIGLFFVLPTAAASAANEYAGVGTNGANILEEIIKFALFLGYILLIGQLEDVKRLFQYHGAEHKTINAYEAGAELTPEVVQTFPIEHPRCGTAFLLNVIVISVILNILIGRFDNNLLLLIPARVITVPIVAGIAYEWLRLSAKHIDKPWVRVIVTPNLWLQKLTTNQPKLEMIEVAIAALERVLVSEGIPVKESIPVKETKPANLGQKVPATS